MSDLVNNDPVSHDAVNHDAASHDAEPLANLAAGQLSEPEARAVEAHIATCSGCAQTFESFRDAVGALRENIAPEQFMTEKGDPSDLIFQRRILGEIRRRKRAQALRRRVPWLVAAAVAVLVALGGGVALGHATAPPSTQTVDPQAGGRMVSGTGVGGASLTATITAAGQSVNLVAAASGLPRGAHCRLVVVAADGRRETAGSWTVPAVGKIPGSAAVPIADVRAVAVDDADTGLQMVYAPV